MARILVTGGAGFLGSEVVEALARRGDEVIAQDLVVNPRLLRLAEEHRNIAVRRGDVTEWPGVVELLKEHQPEAIVHCAALVGVVASLEAPQRTFQVNLGGTLNLFEAMRLFGVRRMVHISSEETYGVFQAPLVDESHPQNPLMAYGISKLAVEHLGRSYRERYGIECINLRTIWVYGPGLPRPRVPKILVEAAVEGRALHLDSGGDFSVDHTHVDDVVNAILAALDKESHPFDAYNVGSGKAVSLFEMVEIIKELVPGARLSIGPGTYYFAENVPAVKKGALDITRAREALGWQPRFDIRAGLADYIDALRARA